MLIDTIYNVIGMLFICSVIVFLFFSSTFHGWDFFIRCLLSKKVSTKNYYFLIISIMFLLFCGSIIAWLYWELMYGSPEDWDNGLAAGLAMILIPFLSLFFTVPVLLIINKIATKQNVDIPEIEYIKIIRDYIKKKQKIFIVLSIAPLIAFLIPVTIANHELDIADAELQEFCATIKKENEISNIINDVRKNKYLQSINYLHASDKRPRINIFNASETHHDHFCQAVYNDDKVVEIIYW